MMPWTIDAESAKGDELLALRAFNFGTEDAPVPGEVLEREYCRLTNQPYPIKEIVFARSWAWFRVRAYENFIAFDGYLMTTIL